MMGKLLAILSALLAPVLFWQATSNAGVSHLGFWNGFRTAELARSILAPQANDQSGVILGISETSLALARQSYASEPLATTSLAILSQSPSIQQSPERRKALIEGTVRLHKRDKLAQALAIEEALRETNYERAFSHFDDLAEMRSEMVRPLIEALQPLLVSDEGRAVLTDALREQPVWSRQLWNSIPNGDEEFDGYLTLREENQPDLDDQALGKLVAALARRGRIAEAHALAKSSLGDALDERWFVDSPTLPPFGWTFSMGANASMVESAERTYSFFIARAQSALLAKQLVSLPPGQYRLSGQVTPQSSVGAIGGRLTCDEAPRENAETREFNLDDTITIGPDCSVYQVEIYGDAWNATTDVRGEIHQISLIAV